MTLTTRLFVGNIPDNFNENDFEAAFSSYGEITNIDIKCKPNVENENKKFGFITMSASNFEVESCIKYFNVNDFNGNRLYVTRARESFLERLQRERSQAQKKETLKVNSCNPIITANVKNQKRNNKRKFSETIEDNDDNNIEAMQTVNTKKIPPDTKKHDIVNSDNNINLEPRKDDKKDKSDTKRLESMKLKRQQFKEKKMIIKTGLQGVDTVINKKIIFSDDEQVSAQKENTLSAGTKTKNSKDLFDDEESDEDINFEIKKQFEGKTGQKVLDLQSKYKSDKRFALDERFMEESSDEEKEANEIDFEKVELEQADEKSKQFNILQDVLGVSIKQKPKEQNIKKSKIGMLRFDPLQPDHAKYLLPVEEKTEVPKKGKKKKLKNKEDFKEPESQSEIKKVEVSNEQFYEISDTLKEAITQPTAFSLRSLFATAADNEDAPVQIVESVAIEKIKNKKVNNPLDPGERNPFKYDSSESENEEEKETAPPVAKTEVKAVWRENLFFSEHDTRLKEGLEYFSSQSMLGDVQKERRQLKTVMKKRLYNNERKNKLFQKKIGGRKKTLKRKKN
ncbi:nucleolar protein 8 [Leptidea sinapis]|uniref:nucleolar protein 8 n=1 Tax=Leptidea sinapis TaxID=189913 RepID=UPI002131714B|nr:nucleolar protein 8 [Leptidea sinapis]